MGYLPVNDTWLGGPRAVGKTADEAKKVYDDVMALEAAGCIAVEMECVPAKVAAEISKRTKMLVFSMGSGPNCDGQFIFAEDLLGKSTMPKILRCFHQRKLCLINSLRAPCT